MNDLGAANHLPTATVPGARAMLYQPCHALYFDGGQGNWESEMKSLKAHGQVSDRARI